MKQIKKSALSLAVLLAILVMFMPGRLGGMTVRADSLQLVTENGVLTGVHTVYGSSGETVTIPRSVTRIGDQAFRYCRAMSHVVIPDSVTGIGKQAFFGCQSLMDVTIPSSVTGIESETFSGCTSLTSVTIPPSVTSIGDKAFYGCTALTSVTIPDSVTTIGKNAFEGCTSLESVKLSGAMTSISQSLFEDCTSLTDVTIPKSVTTVDRLAFENCANLTRLGVDSRNACYSEKDGVFFNKNQTELILCPEGKEGAYSIPASVTSIGRSAFYNCNRLTSVTIPDSVSQIGSSAFSHCNGLTELTIPSSVTKLPSGLFYYSKNLSTVTIPDSITDIGDALIYSEVKTIFYDGSEGQWSALLDSVVHPWNSVDYPAGYVADELAYTLWEKEVHFGKVLRGISVNTLPSKTTYKIGETFNPAGLTCKMTYEDGSTSTVAGGFTCTPVKLQTEGKQLITVKCGKLSTSFYVTVKGEVVRQIRVVQQPSRVVYIVGQRLETSGMKVKVTYADGKEEEITQGFACSPSVLNQTGHQLITVTHGGVATSFTVFVDKKVSRIYVAKNPSKVWYAKGETLDPSGLAVRVLSQDGQERTWTSEFSGFRYSPTKLETVGTQWVTVTYGGTAAAFPVKVLEKAVSAVAVQNKPTKQIYTVGESFNPAGMKLKVTYADNTTEEVTGGFTCTPSGKLTSTGQQKIMVNYGGKTTGFYVTVREAGKAVSSVVIQNKPTKQTYTVGESFNSTGMKLKVTYADGTTAEITSGYTCSPTKFTAVGTQWITVMYGGTATATPVTVREAGKAVSRVVIQNKPTKQTYTVGESFNASGIKLKVTYVDNATAEITSGFTYTPTGKLNTAGQQKIVVSYGGKSTGFYVTVVKAISSVTIAKKPTKQTYTVGEFFDPSGMKLKVTYTDNSTAEITSGFTYTPTGKLNTAGQQKIVVSYGGKSTGFYVTVNAAGKTVSSVTIAKKPTKQTYNVGEAFAPAGMKLKVTYTDNSTAEITSGFTYTPTGKLNTAGQQKIVVSYGGKSTGFYVTVNKVISSVTIAKKPTKQTYTVGEFFNPSGMKLKVTYSDNTTAEITDSFTFTPSGQLKTAGQQKIVVSYGGKSTGFYVTVQ